MVIRFFVQLPNLCKITIKSAIFLFPEVFNTTENFFSVDKKSKQLYNQGMNNTQQSKTRIDIDAYITDFSTVKFSNIFITKLGLMKDNPHQYFDYLENERHDFCIQYIIDGEGFFHTNNTLYSVKKGDLFLLPNNKEHYYKANPDNPYNYYWIHFNGVGFEKFMSLIDLSDDKPIIRNIFDEEIVAIFEKLVNISKKKTNLNQLIMLSLGYELLYRIAFKVISQENPETDNAEQTCNEITNFIIENFDKNINLSDIADHVFMDKYNMLKLYKSVTGFTPVKFLINYRIEYACVLLKQGCPVNEVAFACGFNDIPNFSVRFKKLMGVSPREFKTANKNISDKK